MSRLDPEKRISVGGPEAGTRRVLIAFVIFTALATNELLGFTDDTDEFFAWHIRAEPTAAFLGAAYASGLVLSVLALRQDRWSRIRVAMVTVTAFTVLTAIATIIHLHLFHLTSGGPPARFAAWLWLAVYFLIPAACLAVVVRQERGHRRSEAVHQPIPGWLMALLGAQGAILFLAGVVLYAGGATRHHTPKGWTAFWPLPLAPMTSLAVGAWLIAFGFAAAMALWERDLSRLFVPAVAYTVFGVLQLSVVLWYRTEVTVDGWLWAYVVLLVTIVAAGGYGWWAAQRAAAAAGSEPTEASRSRVVLSDESPG